MARIRGITANEAGLGVKIAYFFARRQLAKLSGRTPAQVLEPLEPYAHVPGLMRAYGGLENMRGRFNLALGVRAPGFSEGMVCAVPAAPQSTTV